MAGTGILSKCGVGLNASWGAAWTAVDTLIPFSSESLEKTIAKIDDASLTGIGGMKKADAGLISLPGDLSGDLDYYNWGKVLEAALGSVATGVYDIVDTNSKVLRLEFEKVTSRWRIGSAKVNRLVISGQKGEAVKITVGLVGDDLTRSSTTFPSLSLAGSSRVLFHQGTFRFADTVDALASGDAVGLESFELTFERNFKTDDYTNQARTILEPKENGFRRVTLRVKLPRYEADTFIDWKDNGTDVQADMVFTDGTKTFKIEIPQMLAFEGFNANIGGPDIVPLEGTFECYVNTDNSTMSAVTKEFRITIS